MKRIVLDNSKLKQRYSHKITQQTISALYEDLVSNKLFIQDGKRNYLLPKIFFFSFFVFKQQQQKRKSMCCITHSDFKYK